MDLLDLMTLDQPYLYDPTLWQPASRVCAFSKLNHACTCLIQCKYCRNRLKKWFSGEKESFLDVFDFFGENGSHGWVDDFENFHGSQSGLLVLVFCWDSKNTYLISRAAKNFFD